MKLLRVAERSVSRRRQYFLLTRHEDPLGARFLTHQKTQNGRRRILTDRSGGPSIKGAQHQAVRQPRPTRPFPSLPVALKVVAATNEVSYRDTCRLFERSFIRR